MWWTILKKKKLVLCISVPFFKHAFSTILILMRLVRIIQRKIKTFPNTAQNFCPHSICIKQTFLTIRWLIIDHCSI